LILVLGTSGSSQVIAAEEEAASTFVSLYFDGACDARNNRLWLRNTHTFKTIVARLRWRAAGGKDLSEGSTRRPIRFARSVAPRKARS